MDKHERSILRVTCVAHMFAHFYELVFPAMTMYVVMDLGVKRQEVFKAAFLLYLLYGCLAPVWGFISDRLGLTKTLGTGMFIAGCGGILAGVLQSMVSLWISLGVIGLGIACIHPACMGLISKAIARRGAALGTFGIWGFWGIISAPLVGGIGGYYWGWRPTMIVTGILGILAGLTSFALKVNIHRDHEKTVTARITSKKAMICFLLLCLCMTMTGMIYRANMVILPAFMEERASALSGWLNQQQWIGISEIGGRGGSVKTLGATLLLSFAYMLGIIGQMMGGYVADRFDLRWGYFTFFLMALPFAIGMIYFSEWAFVFTTGFFMIFTLGTQPLENSLLAWLTPPRWRSTFYGFKFILTFGLAANVVWFIDAENMGSIYMTLSGIIILAMIFVLILARVSRGIDMKQYVAVDS